MKRAFTLIELLVVVLIIGILAAVALPQYQKAVNKARVVEAKTILTSMERASQLCHLEYGENTDCVDRNLWNIEIPSLTYWRYDDSECASGNGSWGCQFSLVGKGPMDGFTIILFSEGYLKAYGINKKRHFECDHYDEDGEIDSQCTKLGFTEYEEGCCWLEPN